MSKVLAMKDIRQQAPSEIERQANEALGELKHVRSKVLAQDMKDVRAVRRSRLLLARLKTRLTELKSEKPKS